MQDLTEYEEYVVRLLIDETLIKSQGNPTEWGMFVSPLRSARKKITTKPYYPRYQIVKKNNWWDVYYVVYPNQYLTRLNLRFSSQYFHDAVEFVASVFRLRIPKQKHDYTVSY